MGEPSGASGGTRLPAGVGGGTDGDGGSAIYQPVQKLTALGQPREWGRQVILSSHLADFPHLCERDIA